MKTIGLVIARMGSSRLPGKSLAEVAGKPLVVQIIERMQSSDLFAEIVLASPDTAEDRPLLEAGEAAGARAFAGASEDVLDRFYQAAKAAKADAIVHIGGDCPFPDHDIMGKALDLLLQEGVDFANNIDKLTYPAGMDTDAIRFEALERMWREAELTTHRVHCLSYLHHFPSKFEIRNFECEEPLGHLRWTVDYPEDLAFVRAVYEALGTNGRYFSMWEILDFVRANPRIGAINQDLSDFVEGQPAYWDSEGFMTDLRADTARVVEQALTADREGRIIEAAERYALAEKFLQELGERARQMGQAEPNA
ncbi:MAG: hypothetical protein QNJ92_17945 [Alphaproteobacteria bacterium]|nr:hypothetical protein [Alphaproteobacteria bacterium]